MNDLLKAALIHFCLAYLHPWFDGNGRMARLIHLWYLVQQRYSSVLFVPLSGYVEKSCRGYYNAYTLAEQNAKISGGMDVTPFLTYFIENVYHKLVPVLPDLDTTEIFQNALAGAMSRKKNRPCGSLSSLSMGKASSPPSSWKRSLVMRPMQRCVDVYSSLRSLGCCGLQNTAIASSIKLQNKPKKCLPKPADSGRRYSFDQGDHNANHTSIHAPLTGSDRPTSQLAAVVTRFQSALPMRGATTWYAPVPGIWSDFNPCSLWGERPVSQAGCISG